MCEDMTPEAKFLIKSEMLNPKSDIGQKLRDFFVMMAVCHTAMVEKSSDMKLKYSASSPDELALVMGAKEVGIEFVEKTTTSITITINGTVEQYETLMEFPFDSTRKRMSLLVKNQNKYYLMTKGADSIMLPRIIIDKEIQQKIEEDLYKFVCDGLRTLVFSKKELQEKEYSDFAMRFKAIKTSADADKDAKLNELFNQMENGLTYLGASAIEDKLQEGVADTIERVMQANIRVWVLTGDKQETAIEIGRSCKLIQKNMLEIILSSASKEEFLAKLVF